MVLRDSDSNPRRFLTIVQDPRGYPGPGAPLEPAPPEGPPPPVVHQVVLADDFDALAAKYDRLRELTTADTNTIYHEAEVMRKALDQVVGLIETASSRARINQARDVAKSALAQVRGS